MRGEIDFLKGQRVGEAFKIKFFHSLKVGSLVLILAYCLVVGVVFSYWLFLSRQAANISNQIAVKKTKIASLKEVESLQVVLKQRLSGLDKFSLAKKGPSFDTLLAFIGQISGEIKVKELKIAEGKMSFSGSSPNMAILEKFLQDLKSDQALTLFSKITLSSVDRQEDGSYFFNLLLETKG
jgi:hypothetical protein